MGKAETGEKLTEQVNQFVDDLQDELSQGHTERYLETLGFFSKFHRYSWGNSVLIAAQFPEATLVAGYRKWQELGFQVRKGASGIAIRAPWLRKELNPDTGQKEEKLIGFFGTYIFDISQTEEYPDKQPPPAFIDPPGDYSDLYAHLLFQVTAQGVEVSELPLTIGHNGYCVLGKSKIVINQSLTDYLKATCLIHEYTHHVSHDPGQQATKQLKTEREWEAESVAYVVCKAIGIENVNSRDYLTSYGLTTDRLGEMMQYIQKTTKRVMADLDLLQPVKPQEAIAAD